MALVTDYTNAGYNAYATVVETDALINDLSPFVNTAKWIALTVAQKESVILNASKDVNCFQYKGTLNPAVISPFNMQFPRSGMVYTNGVVIPDNIIPEFVKEYVARRSIELLNFGPDDANQITIPNNVKRNKVGSLEQEFFGPEEMTANTLSLTDYQSYACTLKSYVLNSSNVIYLMRA